MNKSPSYKDLYELVDERTQRIEDMFNAFHKEEFEPLKGEVHTLTAKVAIFGSGLVLGVNLLWEALRMKFFNKT